MNLDGSKAEESIYNNTLDEAGMFAYSTVKKYGECAPVNESILITFFCLVLLRLCDLLNVCSSISYGVSPFIPPILSLNLRQSLS
jgi:hypothetical protein